MLTTLLSQQVPTGKLIGLIGGAIVVLIVLGAVVMGLRRRLLGGEETGGGLDMETLQRQHRAGEISEEEFKTLRRAILGLPAEKSEQGVGGSAGTEAPDS